MGINLRAQDLLTLLSLKTDGIFRVKFKGEKGEGFLVFKNGELQELEYAGRYSHDLMDELLEEGPLEVLDIEEIVLYDSMSLVEKILLDHMNGTEGFAGVFLVKPDGKIKAIGILPEKEGILLPVVKEIISKKPSIPFRTVTLDSGEKLIAARLKEGLHVVVLTTEASYKRIIGFLEGLRRIFYEG